MARPEAREEDKLVETWESTISGSTWVFTYDRRNDNYVPTRVGGEGAKRLRITRDDRKYNQERIPDENRGHDPFTNGALRLVDTANRDEPLDIRYHYTDAELAEMFEVRDDTLFQDAIEDIESELIIRRMMAMAEKLGTIAQTTALKETAEKRWPIGGTQRTVREMMEAGDRIGATQIY